MKYTLPAANYSFNASAKTITFSGTIPARISNVMHVANITRGVIYFQPQAGVAFSGSYTSPVLTLAASTSGHSSSDELLIVLDDSTTALTDDQLRASAVPVSVSGVATAANQATTNTTLGNIDGDIGAPADAAASSDTGTFSVIALVKRGLQNWTTLQAKIPALVSGAVPTSPNLTRSSGNVDANTLRTVLAADGPAVTSLSSIDSKTAALVSGRVPVDGSGVTQPVSAASLPLPSGAATSANQTTANSSLSSIDGKLPALINGRSGVEPLGQPGVARQLAASSTSANTALTTTCRRISVFARGADIRFAIGSSSQTASSTSHYIANGERLDLVVPATPNIAVIRAGSIDGTLEVSELV